MGCKLIADGGSTKVHWVIGRDGNVVREFFSHGVNPYVAAEKDVRAMLAGEVKPVVDAYDIDEVRFYGAGCRDRGAAVMHKALQELLDDEAHVVVDSDITGACIGLMGKACGIGCILGTGANSCLWNGVQIEDKVVSLGYVLGDEGSGAWLGKTLAAAVARQTLPVELCVKFYETYGLGREELISGVYRPETTGMAPNRFLAGFAPFLSEHIGWPEIKAIVDDGVRQFFEFSVAPYFNGVGGESRSVDGLAVNFVGSVARAFEPLIRAIGAERGYKIGRIEKSPIDGLIREMGFKRGEC